MDRTGSRLRRLFPLIAAVLLATAAFPTMSVTQGILGDGSSANAAVTAGRIQIPAIGLSNTVYEYGCRGGTLPNLVERWGCAGQNNTYLLGHAWGVFRPLHDGYAQGRLQLGQVAYLTSGGVTQAYRVAWIRIVPSTYVWRGLTGDAWAWNATDTPVITLQTCWGSSSAYRLIVRLTR